MQRKKRKRFQGARGRQNPVRMASCIPIYLAHGNGRDNRDSARER